MQGIQTKYYLCEAERGDFVGNRQANLAYKKDMASTFAAQFSSGRPEVDMRRCGSTPGMGGV